MPTAHDAVPNRSPPSTASAHYDRASLFEKLSRQSGQIRQILERAGTRSVCPEDFRNAVRSLGHSEQSDEAIDRCFAALDEDAAGVLSIDDIFDRLRPYVRDPRKKRVFLPLGGSRGAGTKLHIPPNSRVPDAAIEQLRELLRANRIRVLDHFHAWDEDRPRPEAVATKISATDFRRALAVLGLRATSEAVDALFRRFDCDYSGFLDYRELKDILRPSTPSPTKRSPSLTKRSPSLTKRSPSLTKRSPSLRKRSPSPTKRSPSPTKRSPGERQRRSPGDVLAPAAPHPQSAPAERRSGSQSLSPFSPSPDRDPRPLPELAAPLEPRPFMQGDGASKTGDGASSPGQAWKKVKTQLPVQATSPTASSKRSYMFSILHSSSSNAMPSSPEVSSRGREVSSRGWEVSSSPALHGGEPGQSSKAAYADDGLRLAQLNAALSGLEDDRHRQLLVRILASLASLLVRSRAVRQALGQSWAKGARATAVDCWQGGRQAAATAVNGWRGAKAAANGSSPFRTSLVWALAFLAVFMSGVLLGRTMPPSGDADQCTCCLQRPRFNLWREVRLRVWNEITDRECCGWDG